MFVVLFALMLYCIYGTKLDFEPYSMLQEDRIVGFFAMDKQNLSNIAPEFNVEIEGYLLDMFKEIFSYDFLGFLVLP